LVIRAALLALSLVMGASPLAAQQSCRLALLLALDVSASVDEAEHRIQRTGLAAALLAPEVLDPLLNGPGPVALAIYEWSGRFQQDVISDWRLVTSRAQVLDIVEDLQTTPRTAGEFPTAIGYAIGFAATLFERAPPCLFQTLDVAGDGQNNDGFPPSLAYQHFPLDGVTVNGLAIGGASRRIEEYFEAEIIRGPGAFVEHALTHQEFEAAMRRKLERELRVMVLGALSP
jgi:hypothetical protein